MASFTTAPLTDHTGVEVTGLDFTAPIDSEDRAVLQRAFAERHVLVIRDQHFTPDQFKAGAEIMKVVWPTDAAAYLTEKLAAAAPEEAPATGAAANANESTAAAPANGRDANRR